ncbi:MAG: DUF4912 domain-containing protein [Treponema sp.]|nr:DUF4912 domain-containing protein [Treponema sp.]
MEKMIVDRGHIESLSFSDLVTLADEYGIDVPEDLDRQFLIAELIEVLSESGNADDDMLISASLSEDEVVLPKNYNETQISAVLENPAWVFVFWNLSDADKQMVKKRACTLSLRICSYETRSQVEGGEKPSAAYEIKNLSSSQEQHVLLNTECRYVTIELVYSNASTGSVLACTPVLEIPEGAEYLNTVRPGQNHNFSEIIMLSGMNDILTDQYENHRQSFS